MSRGQLRILVYAFEAFGDYKLNISQQVLNQLRLPAQSRKATFRVVFDRGEFVKVLHRYKPNVVLGLGQHPRARKIRIERRARNLYTNSHLGAAKPIDLKKPTYIYSTLPRWVTSDSTISDNCGLYVCNYSMWLVGQWCKRAKAEFGFLHIPQKFPVECAVHYIENYLKIIASGKISARTLSSQISTWDDKAIQI